MKTLIALVLTLVSIPSHAHVKWFSNYDFQQRPLQLAELNSPIFWGLFILSILTILLFVWLDKLGEKSQLYKKVEAFLDQYSEQGPLIMRISMGAVLLMSWQGNSVIAPEIAISDPIWGWFQFGLALLLLFKGTTPLAGLGIVFLYFKGISEHGFFHMLDYVVYPSVGLFLIFSYLKHERLKNFDLPVLYSGLGFSLCWVAFEKMVYPYWGLSVLEQAPALTMGLPHDFFLLSCAFIEFTLGYLLIICLLHRPLAIIITLVFFTTTVFFGKTEVVGHTILHGALLVFIVKGPGHYYQAPIRFHKKAMLRYLFSVINFIILFVALGIPYQKLSQEAYTKSMAKRAEEAHAKFDMPKASAPSVMVHASKDPNGGWNIHLMTDKFTFTPENAGNEDVEGEGHAHLFVNGKKVARVYSNWFHINLPKGKNKLKANLTTNTHKDYAADGELVEHEIELNEEREGTAKHVH